MQHTMRWVASAIGGLWPQFLCAKGLSRGDDEVQPVRFPNRVEDITSEILTDVISQTHPGAAVDRDLRRFLDGSS
jgi:hypothetical protein